MFKMFLDENGFYNNKTNAAVVWQTLINVKSLLLLQVKLYNFNRKFN